uniref:ANK_REP_REGION domain-containing protein n=1 Tax=Parascaris equorum TaxID=6256 RepID=A0A914RTT0_PAREQ
MGENLLHTCMLHNTADHNELVRVIVKKYPKMVNDVFISEDYYGLSPLHQAIVNEDIEMVYFLLRYKADVHQRCYGSFFCADDQKASRTDSLEHEWVDLVQNTRYTGSAYVLGRVPTVVCCVHEPARLLSFVACLQGRSQYA